MDKSYTSNGPEETRRIAKEFCKSLSGPGPVIVELVGDLGAGKTTFMKGVGEFFGVKEDIISPTFLIERAYKIEQGPFKKLSHIDAYRIEKASELDTIGWSETSSAPENLIFIEWPANIQTDLPGAMRIEFEHVGESTRKIKFADENER